MLITRCKDRELIDILKKKRCLVLKCFGCREVYFPEEEIDHILKEAGVSASNKGRFDYLCREEFTERYLKYLERVLKEVDSVVVFSCGVGVQVVSKMLPEIPVIPGCDTYYINGFQGITAQDVDCQQCGECWLNITGGICPITSCSKGLLNGPCGGAKNGKCEVNPEMDCGWVLIYKRLKALGETEMLKKSAVNIRDYRIIIEGRKDKDESGRKT